MSDTIYFPKKIKGYVGYKTVVIDGKEVNVLVCPVKYAKGFERNITGKGTLTSAYTVDAIEEYDINHEEDK